MYKDQLKILIVDDDMICRRHMGRTLANSALAESIMLYAKSMGEVLQILKDHKFDIVLLDLNLPDSGGLDTLSTVIEAQPSAAIIIVTGMDDKEIGLEAISKGAQDYLPKNSYDVSTLEIAIRYAIERKHIQESLREGKDNFRRVIERLNDVVYSLSLTGEITYVSPSISDILGYDIADVTGKQLTDFIHPEDIPACKSYIAELLQGKQGASTLEHRTRHKDGTWRWHICNASITRDENGEAEGIVGISHDITNRRQVKEELEETQQELQQILSASAPLCVIDRNYEIRVLNDTFCSLLGGNIDTLVGRKCYEVIHEANCHTENCALKRALSNPGRQQYETNRTNGAGQETFYMATATPYFNADYSEVIGVVVNYMDITERKQAEKAITETNAKLEQANRELGLIHGQLVQNEKLASIGQLAAGVAHEINTPVGFVASNFETLQKYMNKFLKLFTMYEDLGKEVQGGNKALRLEKIKTIYISREEMKIDFIMEDLEELFSDSREDLERITGIVQNLRDFSRIDQAGNACEYNLNDGIKATLTVAQNEIKYDANIYTELTEIPPLLCNSGQVNQVFLNILVNAAQAIKSQEREKPGTITIKTYTADNYAVCEISDDGPGINMETKSKIFDPFFTTKDPGKGTGLGLSVSHDIIVNKHHGQLSVDSTPGKGTTFTIQLPIKQHSDDDVNSEQVMEGLDDCRELDAVVCQPQTVDSICLEIEQKFREMSAN